ncbi:cysteinyl-tRNA synthetase [Heterostelium album PN500]|uniref:cysteine--tRNA ligase n=1 Tax=Heterostelium pallidum (strain ATCC 26659 / Pp 5 / PN500) TaxID=670386 RepID=D3BQM3_HETP5|nr:cysteinyl-tRNA synthetase [Heterostelium album PN500]EFA76443.1 cysteinyl-tRNA synthetase [Heterostelium album PN500]|eukprot:XP_020428575.1 cysteinyl-tRNA synthetase [Heterostelium album PN500]
MSGNTSPTLQGKKKREQPEWFKPAGQPSELQIYNSLTSSKVPFTPISGGKSVSWYICGPTVYDASHMGHARSYISFDIIRRIMKDYLGYDVQYIMNITDIDDKIIIRSREQGITHTELSRKWENSFFDDLKALNVLPPDALTRVTEYVPEIVTFVEKIIANGFAYESNGSVYFDTEAYMKVHEYGKLEPSSVGNEKLNSEGEGALSAGSDKRNNNDFALWKKSKEGEPKWNSPWGEGRPGWHIECSAMASDILGANIDIHSGGEDLKFPHHDNEIAQSEAHYGCKQWINYFIHSGHLLIDGLKMSKSLKNFITIQDALKKYTARQIRMLFLIHRYDKPMNYSTESMTNVIEIEKIFTEFFHAVKSIVRDAPQSLAQNWEQVDKDLNNQLLETKKKVHEFLLDNFNTTDAIHALNDLVKRTNVYLADKNRNPRLAILNNIATYITHILRVFGLVEGSAIGFGSGGSANVEDTLKPVLDALVEFRNQIRSSAINKDFSKILQSCDHLRDEVLPLLGVKIDDKSGNSVWKFEDKEVLKKEMELKKEIEAKKLADKLEKERKEKEKFELSKIPASELFKKETDKYSQFDERGVPTHDKEGNPITKSQLKKLQTAFDTQAKNHQKYLDSIANTTETKQ